MSSSTTPRSDTTLSQTAEFWAQAENGRLEQAAACLERVLELDPCHAGDRDPAQLAYLRSTLRQQVLASPLFDAPRFARRLEDALWPMWHGWQSNHRTGNVA